MAVMGSRLSRRLISVCNAIQRLFNACMTPGKRRRGGCGSGGWIPAVDLYETDDALILKAELAGFSEADVTVQIKDRAIPAARFTSMQTRGERSTLPLHGMGLWRFSAMFPIA